MPTIAIFENDPAMRALLAEWLADAGYRVRAARAPGAGIIPHADVVLVDVRYRAAGAQDTLEAVKRDHPGARLVGLSTQLNHRLEGDSALARAAGVRYLLPKPCTRDELLQAVTGALAEVA